MRVEHSLGFVACEVAELDGEVTAAVAVVARGGEEDTDVRVDEFVRVVAGGAKVEEFEFVGRGVEEKVCPVGVCLHEFEIGDFAQTEAENMGSYPVLLGLGERLRFGNADTFHAFHS